MRTTKNSLIFKRPVKGRGFFAPRYSPGAHRLIRILSRLYLPLIEKVGRIEIQGLDSLTGSFDEFHRGNCRLIILFRHPSRKDPTVLGYAFNVLLPGLAKKAGRPLSFIPHARFLYGKDVLNWAGAPAVWAFPRLGHIPIQNLGANREGMNLLRRELKEGPFPVILAPEGQVTYHIGHCADLASGFTSLTQWGLESGKDVVLLPVALGYRYGNDPEDFTKHVLGLWQKETGFYLSGLDDRAGIPALLEEAGDKTLSLLEDFYRIPRDEIPGSSPNGEPDSQRQRDRIERICLAGLKAAEELAGLRHGGTLLERVFRIRYEGMGRIYVEEGHPRTFHPLKRNISDFRSLEARVFLRHSQIVDVLEYLDPGYLNPPCPPSRRGEYALNLLDAVNRLKGGNINTRWYPPGHRALIRAGEPIRLKASEENGLGTKKARQELNRRVRQALEDLSLEMEV